MSDSGNTCCAVHGSINETIKRDVTASGILERCLWAAERSCAYKIVGADVSFMTGAAGIAYALYRLWLLDRDEKCLRCSHRWIGYALDDTTITISRTLSVFPSVLGSLYHGLAGRYCVKAMIAHAYADFRSRDAAIHNYLALCNGQPSLDLLFGAPGQLIGILTLLHLERGEKNSRNSEFLHVRGHSLCLAMLLRLRDYQEHLSIGRRSHLGIAHGISGVLFAALRWYSEMSMPLPDILTTEIVRLANHAVKSKHGVCWPLSVGDNSTSLGWCTGTAGILHLLSLAIQCTEPSLSVQLRSLAEGAALHACQANTMPHLCCGASGQCYALVAFYNRTHDERWLTAARRLASGFDMALSDAPYDLYRGTLGIALLLRELRQPEQAAMPLFAVT